MLSLVSKSLFTSDRNLHKYTNKVSVTFTVFKYLVCKIIKAVDIECNGQNGVVIFDNIAIVNTIDIKKLKTITCLEFDKAFVSFSRKESQRFNEIRVIFDRYTASSLKSYTRTTRKAGGSVQYEILDKNKIGHLETNVFTEKKNNCFLYWPLLESVSYVTVFRKSCKTNVDANGDLCRL